MEGGKVPGMLYPEQCLKDQTRKHLPQSGVIMQHLFIFNIPIKSINIALQAKINCAFLP